MYFIYIYIIFFICITDYTPTSERIYIHSIRIAQYKTFGHSAFGLSHKLFINTCFCDITSKTKIFSIRYELLKWQIVNFLSNIS